MAVKKKELNDLIVRESLYKLNDIAEDKLFNDDAEAERNYENLPIDQFKNHS